MRAGDADRDRVAEILRAAYAEGRLDATELDERLAAVYAAKTVGQLAPLTRDLPVPGAGPPATLPDRSHDRSPWSMSLVGWTAVALVVLTVLTRGRAAPLFVLLIPLALLVRSRQGPGAPKERPGRQDGERDHR
jgi:hypothetical protein